MTETTRIKLWQFSQTEKAYGFSSMPKGDATGQKIWLPKSQIVHISRQPYNPLTEWQPCIVEIPDWLAEKNNL